MARSPAIPRRIPLATLGVWFGEIGGKPRGATRSIAHGGTALSLLGVKESTKDVDLSFEDRADYERFRDTLSGLGYRVVLDSAPAA